MDESTRQAIASAAEWGVNIALKRLSIIPTAAEYDELMVGMIVLLIKQYDHDQAGSLLLQLGYPESQT